MGGVDWRAVSTPQTKSGPPWHQPPPLLPWQQKVPLPLACPVTLCSHRRITTTVAGVVDGAAAGESAMLGESRNRATRASTVCSVAPSAAPTACPQTARPSARPQVYSTRGAKMGQRGPRGCRRRRGMCVFGLPPIAGGGQSSPPRLPRPATRTRAQPLQHAHAAHDRGPHCWAGARGTRFRWKRTERRFFFARLTRKRKPFLSLSLNPRSLVSLPKKKGLLSTPEASSHSQKKKACSRHTARAPPKDSTHMADPEGHPKACPAAVDGVQLGKKGSDALSTKGSGWFAKLVEASRVPKGGLVSVESVYVCVGGGGGGRVRGRGVGRGAHAARVRASRSGSVVSRPRHKARGSRLVCAPLCVCVCVCVCMCMQRVACASVECATKGRGRSTVRVGRRGRGHMGSRPVGDPRGTAQAERPPPPPLPPPHTHALAEGRRRERLPTPSPPQTHSTDPRRSQHPPRRHGRPERQHLQRRVPQLHRHGGCRRAGPARRHGGPGLGHGRGHPVSVVVHLQDHVCVFGQAARAGRPARRAAHGPLPPADAVRVWQKAR